MAKHKSHQRHGGYHDHDSYHDGHHHKARVSQHHKEGGGSDHLRSDPDRGHPMIEGEMPFDKGYEMQLGNSSPYFPERKMRGNDYQKLQNEIKGRDMTKLERSKFTKIA